MSTLSLHGEAVERLANKMVKLFGQRDNEKDLILLSKIYKNAKFDGREFIRLFLKSKHKAKLQNQFFTLEMFKK